MGFALWMWLACGPAEEPGEEVPPSDADTAFVSPTGDTATGTTDTDTGETATTPPVGRIAFVEVPLLEPAPNPSTPLGFVATIETDWPGIVELELASPDHTWLRELPVDGTLQSWPVVGVLPDTTYTATFRARDAYGDGASFTTTVATPPLPEGFPSFEVLHAEPSRMEPGLTLVAPAAPANQGAAYVCVVDEQGRVLWFHTVSRYAAEAHFDEDGDLVYLDTRRQLEVVDLLGNVGTTIWPMASRFAPAGAIGPEVPAFHHDMHPLPGGELLGLSIEMRVVDGMPTSDTDPDAPTVTSQVAGDVILRLDRSGNVLHRIDVLDLLDPQRIGYDSLTSTYWHYLFGPGTLDWSHTNNVIYREDVDQYVFSVRNQDAVVAVGGASGEVEWMLAPQAHWGPEHLALLLEPVGADFRHSYHPHGPEWTPDDTLLLFDNGTHGASAFEPPLPPEELQSRAVELAIDPVAGTVEQVWSYEPGLYALAMGDADHLPSTRNVLAVFGTLDDPEVSARIHEVTRTTPPELVFELVVHTADGVAVEVRESDRIPDLYPPGGPQPLD